MTETHHGRGWAVGSLDGMGAGPGFRKVRRELGVTAFGVNAVVLPPGYRSGRHLHERQEELYFVHSGSIEFTFSDDETRSARAPAASRAWIPRRSARCRNASGSEDAVYLCVGGAGGYVGRDGKPAEGEPNPR